MYARNANMWILSVSVTTENIKVYVRTQKRTKAHKKYTVYFHDKQKSLTTSVFHIHNVETFFCTFLINDER